MARHQRPDVAVVDLLMPGMDGIEVIAVIGGENDQPQHAPALPDAAPQPEYESEFEREALAA